ncbi:MAG: DNA primase, partial [bacterium]
MTDLDLIKSKIDIVDFIGKYIPLKKAGVNYKAVCPFHMEKTPSFMISPDKQIWHCFGCGRGGDVFRFVMEKEGVEFVEALKILADQAGVQLSKAPLQGADTKKTLYSLNELAAKYFEKALIETASGRKAKDYLVGRGLTLATITEFRIGYAPEGGKALVEFLRRREFSEADIEKAGLAIRKGNYLQDKFVNRVMFPLCDNLGRAVAFTGRVLDPRALPKYLNSPETPIFHKSDVLYGIHLAKTHIQQSGQVILVEGQMDVISSHQAGIKNVVGVSGTALTPEQVKTLSRYAQDIVLALDADTAGGEATKRAVELAGEFDLGVKVALLGEYKDPDSAIKDSPDKWEQVVTAAVSVMDFYFSQAATGYDLKNLEQRKLITRRLLPIINKLPDPVERDHYLKQLGRLVDVEPRILYDALQKSKAPRSFAPLRSQTAPAAAELTATWL